MPTVRAWLAGFISDRRRAQSGTTLIEVLVSLTIASLALSLVVGTISTGLLDATLAKRNTATQAVIEYEMEQVSATAFSASFSDCFATEDPTSPSRAAIYQGACPTGPYSLRADVNLSTTSGSAQLWVITVRGWPSGSNTGASVQMYAAH
jgi:prepilin-type N-terminal cleavage/methylation domain-containing protein